MSTIVIERNVTFGYVKEITFTTEVSAISHMQEMIGNTDDPVVKFAYEYAYERIVHASGQHRPDCSVVRSRFLATCKRHGYNEDAAMSAWNEMCRPFTC